MGFSMLTDDIIERATAFHGHLGPFLILGLKMGLLAREKMAPEGLHSLKAVVKTKLRPPYSCIIDGIQVASLCTLGKGNIQVIDDTSSLAIFESKTKKIRIKVKDEVINDILSRKLKRESPEMIKFSRDLANLEEAKLFEIEEKE